MKLLLSINHTPESLTQIFRNKRFLSHAAKNNSIDQMCIHLCASSPSASHLTLISSRHKTAFINCPNLSLIHTENTQTTQFEIKQFKIHYVYFLASPQLFRENKELDKRLRLYMFVPNRFGVVWKRHSSL